MHHHCNFPHHLRNMRSKTINMKNMQVPVWRNQSNAKE
jgi:hypothetical protein